MSFTSAIAPTPVIPALPAADSVLSLLAQYQLMPQFWREHIVDQAIAPIHCTAEETAEALHQFFAQRQLTTEEAQQAWVAQANIDETQLEAIATRSLRITKFKEIAFGVKLESYYLNRARQLDTVVYSLIRLKDPGIAHELYFRIESGEQSFADLSRRYSLGSEAGNQGIVGPVELGNMHPALAKLLRSSHPGELHMPMPLGEWVIIVRLEKLTPVQFDEALRQRLLNELFEQWLQEQMGQLPESHRAWLMPTAA
ncbi:peptidylprolyl isomerase [Leptolyngbya sp. AN02str]|uniref:peptidylprolyl isomerase n=1 Tax=Leptolyngbya sp. AN02str TaxID=3423363 RepID=UPI003D321D91